MNLLKFKIRSGEAPGTDIDIIPEKLDSSGWFATQAKQLREYVEEVIAPLYKSDFFPLFANVARKLLEAFKIYDSQVAAPLAYIKDELRKVLDTFSESSEITEYEKAVTLAEAAFKDGIRAAYTEELQADSIDANDLSIMRENKLTLASRIKEHVRAMAGYEYAIIARVSYGWMYFRMAALGLIILAIEIFAGLPIFRSQSGTSISGLMWSGIAVLVLWITAELSADGIAKILAHKDAKNTLARHYPGAKDPDTDRPVKFYGLSSTLKVGTWIAFSLFVLASLFLLVSRFMWAENMRGADSAKIGAVMIVFFSWVYFVITLLVTPRYEKDHQREYERLLDETERLEEEIEAMTESETKDYAKEVERLETQYNDAADAAEQQVADKVNRVRDLRNGFLRFYAEYEKAVGSFQDLYHSLTNTLLNKVIADQKLDGSQVKASLDTVRIAAIFDDEFTPKLTDAAFYERVSEFRADDISLPTERRIREFTKIREAVEAEVRGRFRPAVHIDLWDTSPQGGKI